MNYEHHIAANLTVDGVLPNVGCAWPANTQITGIPFITKICSLYIINMPLIALLIDAFLLCKF